MTFSLPQILPHCKTPTQQFCASCRDREGGKLFRSGVLDRQGLDDVEVDFDCPLGKPWATEELPKPKPAPRKLSEEDIRIAELRADVCESCEHSRKVSRVIKDFQVYRVSCDKCGCAARSLVDVTCPIGLHPE